ncbi:phosphate transport system regulatory protein PhoU [Sphingobium jiangsuense]|uniref:Phosphate-specific transport system accessory protein PhoU n=1 Tax=Sphingobium jiangsuense TaxID=870476 RepID=A0A7W6FR98_9SPHN|nr:phosphate signaling complex protein PhoU [Sphingobium jiangsuense]MBB3927492.1 phosphate transport system protein [Sphingobium jiangsuense]GLT00056.1 phosphate transport system regulatory protein PhoU [Sphingobium jiangsuense]
MPEHTIKAFDEEINRLRGLVAEMGGRVETALEDAMAALVEHDNDKARRVVSEDRKIDLLEAEVEKLVVQIIALRAPMANDLRDVIAALKIVGVVERIGDYAKNIAKRVPQLGAHPTIEPLSLLPAMAQVAGEMVGDALNAFAARDAALAEAVVARDHVVDSFYNGIFRALLTYMVENPKTISECAHLLFIAKNIERIGDHATNMAEMVYYAATGDYLPERGRDTGIES